MIVKIGGLEDSVFCITEHPEFNSVCLIIGSVAANFEHRQEHLLGYTSMLFYSSTIQPFFIYGLGKYGGLRSMGFLDVWGSWKYGGLRSMGVLEVWGSWKYGGLGSTGIQLTKPGCVDKLTLGYFERSMLYENVKG